MKLIDAFEEVADLARPAWKAKSGWNPPFCYNRAHILRLLGPNTEVDTIKKRELLAMRKTLMEEPGQKGKRTAGGVNRIMSMINTLLKELTELEVIDSYPKIKPLKEPKGRTTFFTKRQVEKMIRVAREVYDNEDLADAILFGAYTGCRQGELLELKVEDIDMENMLLTFRDTKNGDDHVIDIHPDLVPVIKGRMALARPDCYLFDFDSDDQLRRDFYKCRDYIGVDSDHVWHSLRHTTATWLVERGVPIQTIAEVLNHKNLSTTQRYAKVSNTARKSAIDLL